MKVLGFILVTGALSLCGFLRCAELNRRVRELYALRTDLVHAEEGVCRLLLPMSEAFRMEEDVLPLFSACAKEMDAGCTPYEAWENAMDATLKESALCASDVEVLMRFGQGLSSVDTEGQAQNFSIFRLSLDDQIRDAEEKNRRLGKLYRSGGVLLGVMIGLFLW